jgi:hypothetical protein
MVRKQHKEKVPKENFTRLVKMNELIHSNPCGPLPKPSFASSRYFYPIYI